MQWADALDAAVVLDDKAAMLGEELTSAIGPAQQGCLCEYIGLERGRSAGCRANQACPGRLAAGRVDQVVSVAAVRVPPETRIEPGGGDGPAPEIEDSAAVPLSGWRISRSTGSLSGILPPTRTSPPQSIA